MCNLENIIEDSSYLKNGAQKAIREKIDLKWFSDI